VGVAIAVVATLLYLRVETESTPSTLPTPTPQKGNTRGSPHLEDGDLYASLVLMSKDGAEPVADEGGGGAGKKTIGVAMALTAGILFGFNFDPVEYLKAS
jgi:hypothetical protein